MTQRQRFVMVADLLTRLRSADVGGQIPAGVVIDGFEATMDRSCKAVPGRYGVTSIARSIYLTQRAHWRG